MLSVFVWACEVFATHELIQYGTCDVFSLSFYQYKISDTCLKHDQFTLAKVDRLVHLSGVPSFQMMTK
jgi:hypothetical protein